MAHIPTDECEMQLNGVSEAMDLLHIDVETDLVKDKPGREDVQYSVSLFNKPSFEIRITYLLHRKLYMVVNSVNVKYTDMSISWLSE